MSSRPLFCLSGYFPFVSFYEGPDFCETNSISTFNETLQQGSRRNLRICQVLSDDPSKDDSQFTIAVGGGSLPLVLLYDVETRSEVWCVRSHRSMLWALASIASPGSSLVLSGGIDDGQILVSDSSSGKLKCEIVGPNLNFRIYVNSNISKNEFFCGTADAVMQFDLRKQEMSFAFEGKEESRSTRQYWGIAASISRNLLFGSCVPNTFCPVPVCSSPVLQMWGRNSQTKPCATLQLEKGTGALSCYFVEEKDLILVGTNREVGEHFLESWDIRHTARSLNRMSFTGHIYEIGRLSEELFVGGSTVFGLSGQQARCVSDGLGIVCGMAVLPAFDEGVSCQATQVEIERLKNFSLSSLSMCIFPRESRRARRRRLRHERQERCQQACVGLSDESEAAEDIDIPPEGGEEAPATAKVCLVGSSGVGKTNLVLRKTQGVFNSKGETTIGAAFCSQTIQLEENRSVVFEIWDTAGQERYHAIAPMYYRGAMGVIVVFDMTSRESFSRAKKWLKEVKSQCSANCVIALVGNKLDLSERRVVQKTEGEETAVELECGLYRETSAKEDVGVDVLFQDLASQVDVELRRIPAEPEWDDMRSAL